MTATRFYLAATAAGLTVAAVIVTGWAWTAGRALPLRGGVRV